MGIWKVLLGRVTLFPAIPSGADIGSALELFKNIWKQDPDSFQKQAQQGSPLAGSVAQGTCNGFSVSCSVNALRIDFTVTPPSLSGTQLSLADDTKKFHDVFSQSVQHSFSDLRAPISRAACSVQFVAVAPDFIEANKIAIAALPNQYALKLSNERDFIFQINRRSRLSDFEMNFLTKWSVENIQVLALQVGSSGQQPIPFSQIMSEYIVASVLFDNNNVLTTALSPNQISVVLKESLRGISDGLREANLQLDGF